MSLKNLNSIHLTEEQTNAVNEALTSLENALKPLRVNLTTEDRNQYGRVNEQNKLFINKIYDFATHQPELRSPDVDWKEFTKDYKTRGICERVISKLEKLMTDVKNRKTLGDFDNYQDALTDYAYTNYKAGTKDTGYEDKHRECKQFFNRTKKTTLPKESNKPTE